MTNYITANGSNLMNGDKIFKFMSFNIPNLLFIEDYERKVYPIEFNGRFANEEEQRDALATI